MWKWLFDAHRLLGISVEILDDELSVLLSSRDGRLLRERFERERGQPLAALLTGLTPRTSPIVVSSGSVRLACAPIVGANVLAGAVLVGIDDEAGPAETDIARLAGLLADTIADQLARSAGEHRGNLHQISALYQLLHAAIATGSEREVIRTFAEALSIWEEIEVLAYRADLNGRFTLAVALPGSDPAIVPRSVDPDRAPDGPLVMGLSTAERAELGFGGPGETILARLSSEGGRWMVAMNAAGVAADVERAEMYAAALGQALNGCVAVETSRLSWAVMQQFVDRDPPHEAARRALDELRHALEASASFAVFGPDGALVFAVGDGRPASRSAAPATEAGTLRALVQAPGTFRAVLEAHTTASREAFNPRDVRLFETVVTSFRAWLPAALRRLGGGERRGIVRSFDQIVDRYARESHAANDAASLILISAGADALSLDTTHAWIRRLRPQLRPTDLAGRLASGELGILLLQTPPAGAHVVARRLSRVLAPSAPDGDPAVRIGVASQIGDLVSAEALIARAREQSLDG
jgi:hypothetical protein